MARNGSGVFSLSEGYLATTGETITASQHNTPLEDLEADANTARPVVAGGTGSTTAAGARSNLGVASAVSNKSGNHTVVAADRNKTFRCTADLTLSLTAAATLGSDFLFTVKADGGDVTIDPDGSETIDGATSLFIPDGSWARVRCTGSAFYATAKIADVDQHYINADVSGSGDVAGTRYTQGVVVGKGWTNTSGVFSPPCVGKFRIEFFAYIDSTTGAPSVTVNESTDGGSNYSGICAVVGEAGTRSSGFAARIVDVTDTSQYRIKATTSWTSGILKGSSTSALSGFIFTYLGPT